MENERASLPTPHWNETAFRLFDELLLAVPGFRGIFTEFRSQEIAHGQYLIVPSSSSTSTYRSSFLVRAAAFILCSCISRNSRIYDHQTVCHKEMVYVVYIIDVLAS